MPGIQLGDPGKAAGAIITVAATATGTAPLHQILGSDSLGFASARVDTLTTDIAASRVATGSAIGPMAA